MKRDGLTFEIALLRRGHLDINNAEKKDPFKAIPGEFRTVL